MKTILRVAAVAAVFALLPVTAEAQAVGGAPVQLTLDDAVRTAMANNPNFLSARNNLRLNRTNTLNTWANTLLPQASLNLLQTSAGGNQVQTAFDEFGNPVENPITDWVYNSSSNQSFNLTWNFTGTSLLRAHRTMQIQNEGREIQLETQTNQVERQVRQQYFSVQQNQFQLELAEAVLEDLQRDLVTTSRLYALGQGTRVDERSAELAIAQQRQTIANQARTLEQARLQLWITLGDPELGPVQIVPEPVRVFEPSGLDADALVLIAQTSSPQARTAENSLESSRISLSEAKQNAWIPSFSSNIRLGRRASARDISGALFEVSDFEGGQDLSFGLSVRIPILSNYFQTKNSLTQAEVNLQNQEATYQQTQLGFEQTVRSAHQNLVSQYEALVLAVASAEIAADALRLARQEYAIGGRTFDQLQQAVTADENARQAVINTQYSFITNFINLENAIGLPVPVDDAAYQRAVEALGDFSSGGIGLDGAGGN